jgi:hypothetical protein
MSLRALLKYVLAMRNFREIANAIHKTFHFFTCLKKNSETDAGFCHVAEQGLFLVIAEKTSKGE